VYNSLNTAAFFISVNGLCAHARVYNGFVNEQVAADLMDGEGCVRRHTSRVRDVGGTRHTPMVRDAGGTRHTPRVRDVVVGCGFRIGYFILLFILGKCI